MIKKILFTITLITGTIFPNTNSIHHDITAEVDPYKNYINVTDKITIPESLTSKDLKFLLVKDMVVESKGIKLIEKNKPVEDTGMDRENYSNGFGVNKYKIKLKNKHTFTIKYSGKINYPIEQLGGEYARSFSQSPGIISEKGVVLGGSSYWIPYFDDNLVTFNLKTIIPESWDVVSQGNRTIHSTENGKKIVQWNTDKPMEEVYLIAAEFTEYHYKAGDVDVMAFLRTPDENLANKYLETTTQYLTMYEKLIGNYPFSKFALIENFWETGYGMASFTLLGSQVIRFPFILHSSYPHELLHNWWGNSAYVDFNKGNWCEGITAYMADHLIKEQRGQGVDYRRSTLQKYSDYVTTENDFPLTEFVSRFNASSEAIGYGKSLMMFDMLRYQLGDNIFVKALQDFYKQNKYKFASFKDIQIAFEKVSGKNLKTFFHQWTRRTGAPELKLENVSIKESGEEFNISVLIKQIQKDEAFSLLVPVHFMFDDEVKIKNVNFSAKQKEFVFTFPLKPNQILIDPQFHVFRKLHPNEIPPALSKNYGSQVLTIILPSKSDNYKTYKELSDIWIKDKSKQIQIVDDNKISNLPSDNAVWIFGETNKFSSIIERNIKKYNSELNTNSINFGKSQFPKSNNSFVIASRNPDNPSNVISLLTIGNEKAVSGLSRKLMHYGKYSYLVFEGDEPTNIGKGQWQAVNSPMNYIVNRDAPNVDLPKEKALAMLATVFSSDKIQQTVEKLTSKEMEGRGLCTNGINKAADYIAEAFKSAGLQPDSKGTYFQKWDDVVDEKGTIGEMKNIIGIIPGSNPSMKDETVIVCAHYDHLGFGWPEVSKGNEGKIHPGADDNASGIAVMLELARSLGKTLKPQRTIIFIAFTAEENGLKGSQYYIDNYKKFSPRKVIGVLNLDTVGRLGKNKLMVLNSSSAREWKFMFMGAGYVTGLESEMISQPLDASDESSFIKIGVPGVQFFTGAHLDYHKPTDTIDKIDFDGMVKIAAFVREAILYLAEREEPLTFTGSGKPSSHPGHSLVKRSASAGFMPDFRYPGKGVKIGAISPDSPAKNAGMKKGDIITKVNEIDIKGLKQYSEVLKKFNPDDIIDISYLRDGEELAAKIKLKAK